MTMHTPTIRAKAEALTADSAAALPAEIVGVFAADRAALEARGVPGGVAEPGTLMPDGDLLDRHGAPTSLAQLRGGRPAVVVFYRGAWCPYCNIALSTYEVDLVPALARRGFDLIAVSPQKPDHSLTSARSSELTFAVASDPGNQLAAALGILIDPSTDSVAAQIKIGIDITEMNADGGRTLPMPTVVVVDAKGVIHWIDVHPNYATRSEVPDILAAVDAVSAA